MTKFSVLFCSTLTSHWLVTVALIPLSIFLTVPVIRAAPRQLLEDWRRKSRGRLIAQTAVIKWRANHVARSTLGVEPLSRWSDIPSKLVRHKEKFYILSLVLFLFNFAHRAYIKINGQFSNRKKKRNVAKLWIRENREDVSVSHKCRAKIWRNLNPSTIAKFLWNLWEKREILQFSFSEISLNPFALEIRQTKGQTTTDFDFSYSIPSHRSLLYLVILTDESGRGMEK